MSLPDDYDIAVVGAGITGLWMSLKAARLDLRVGLFDAHRKVAGGASSGNEGWLHRGTYHAVSVADRDEAIRVARRCIYGHDQIAAYAPEAVEWSDGPAIALIRDPDRVAEAVDRWCEAGVRHQELTPAAMRLSAPEVDLRPVAAAFEVDDRGLDGGLLQRRLFVDGARAGVESRLGSRVGLEAPGVLRVTSGGEDLIVRAGVVVLATGYATAELLGQIGPGVQARRWKSHIAHGPRVLERAVFYVDPGEATVMNHDGNRCVVGQNEDAYPVDAIDLAPDAERVAGLLDALGRLAPAVDQRSFNASSCIKVDLLPPGVPRSVAPMILEPWPSVLVVVPGKMTEAPFVTDLAVRRIYSMIGDELVTQPVWRRTQLRQVMEVRS